METLRLDMPAEDIPHVILALHQATESVLRIDTTGRADIDASNVWTDMIPRLIAQLKTAANTEYDHETGRALTATARHLEAVYAARLARRHQAKP